MYQNYQINPFNFHSFAFSDILQDQNFYPSQDFIHQHMLLQNYNQHFGFLQLFSIPFTMKLFGEEFDQANVQDRLLSASHNMYFSSDNIKLEEIKLKFEEFPPSANSLPQKFRKDNDENNNNSIRIQIIKILSFFLNEFGKTPEENIFQRRHCFSHDEKILKVFDSLFRKYSMTIKSKEDMSRFVLRKALTHLRDCLRRQLNTNAKTASVALCKKYFKSRVQEIATIKKQKPIDDDDDKNTEILNFLLPYKKNSRNKTPNSCFVKEIFSSEVFCQDYRQYIERFDEILQEDNEKKITKFIDFLVKCVQENNISQVSKYKRLPWLKYWLENAKKVACELLETNLESNKAKELKNKRLKKNYIWIKKEELNV